ncbi:phage antirepressor [Furfurilactobacillus curtus]|uniref:Phage antirepressor KilAC domain-containing protein n=1 Tax=Furfurilactobacillus curtus TaxID=1746200 RepID=A0ABQ5JKA5_9LACO
MEELQNFVFQGNQVRTVIVDDEPYFVGKDVADILGYAKSRNAISSHVDNEDKKDAPIQGPLGGTQNMTIISESGVYSLIFGSHLESAKLFKRWVTGEVLPTIRKHGAYMTPATIEDLLTNPDNIIKLATQLKTEREGRLIAEQKVNELQPKATYYDLILRNKSLLSITKVAKDYGWSGAKMNKELHRLGVQYKQSKTWLLYQKYATKGYTQSQTFVDDEDTSHMNTYWTQAGRIFIYETLKNEGILPLIESEQTA